MRGPFDQELEDRLIRYAEIDTQSDEASGTSPSTEKQFDLLNLLIDELRVINAADILITDYGTVLATVPPTVAHNVPTIALLGHVDTSPGFSGTAVKPRVFRNYNGSEITFPDDSALVLSPATSPYLASKIGDDIITASGATLLGADDKAGVAIVMTVAKHLLDHPNIEHGPIRICFTPDEEIGRGVDPNLPADLAADFAYTLDGADLGEIDFETFSADKAVVQIHGVSIHPGDAKDVMVNALHLAAKILERLPADEKTPETTDGRKGYIHAYQMNGSAAEAEIHFILRDFEDDLLREHGDLLQRVCNAVALAEPRARITCSITRQYRNMHGWLAQDMRPVDLANASCRQVGIDPFSVPIRGGTDGSRLTEMGVPTPNIFTGMQAVHGPLEWISVQDMARATDVCIALTQQWAGEASDIRSEA